MTIKEIIEALLEESVRLEGGVNSGVKFCTSPSDELAVLSIYAGTESGILFFDLEEGDEEAVESKTEVVEACQQCQFRQASLDGPICAHPTIGPQALFITPGSQIKVPKKCPLLKLDLVVRYTTKEAS